MEANKKIDNGIVWFRVKSIRLTTEINFNWQKDVCWANVVMEIDGKDEQTAADGIGPVDACFKAMKKLLVEKHEQAKQIRLVKFSVPEKDVSAGGSEATVLVRIALQYNGEAFTFEAENDNIEKACAYAFIEGFNFCLSKMCASMNDKKSA